MTFIASSSVFEARIEPATPCAPNRAQGVRKIMAKADSAESIRDSIRAARESIRAEVPAVAVAKPIVEGWVDEMALQRQGKRTAAYHGVAWLFDCSESWVRRLLADEVEGFDSNLFQRIVASKPWLRKLQVARGRALIGEDLTNGSEGGDAP